MIKIKSIWGKRETPNSSSEMVINSIPRRMSVHERSDYRTTPAIMHRGPVKDTREAERFVPQWRETLLVTEKDKKIPARILNMSALGVAVEADFSKVSPQSVAKIGKRSMKPGRRMMGGAVFLFDPPLPKRACVPDIVL